MVKENKGVKGLGMATSLTYFTCWLLTTLYCNLCLPKIRKALRWPGKEIFHRWGQYLKISLPTSVVICANGWAYQLMILIAGLIGVTPQAAQTIITTVSSILSQIPGG